MRYQELFLRDRHLSCTGWVYDPWFYTLNSEDPRILIVDAEGRVGGHSYTYYSSARLGNYTHFSTGRIGVHVPLVHKDLGLDLELMAESLLISAWCSAKAVGKDDLWDHFRNLDLPFTHKVLNLPNDNQLAVSDPDYLGVIAQCDEGYGLFLNLCSVARVG